MCGVVWCKSRQILANSNTFLLFLPRQTKKTTKLTPKTDILYTTHMNCTAKYISPVVEIVEIDLESPVLSGSPTGESFDSQENFDGEWS